MNAKEKPKAVSWDAILTGILIRIAEAQELIAKCSCDGLQEIVVQLTSINATLAQMLAGANTAQSAEGSLMPATIIVGGAGAKFTFTEFSGPNGTGVEVPPSGPITYASDNTAVGTVDSSGNVAAVAPGTCNISGLDPASVNKVNASDVLTVEAAPPPVAESATGVLTAN